MSDLISHQFQYKLINILIPMIKSEFTLFEMKIKGCFGDTVKFHESPFGVGPE